VAGSQEEERRDDQNMLVKTSQERQIFIFSFQFV
jgi:hypothetical protein